MARAFPSPGDFEPFLQQQELERNYSPLWSLALREKRKNAGYEPILVLEFVSSRHHANDQKLLAFIWPFSVSLRAGRQARSVVLHSNCQDKT